MGGGGVWRGFVPGFYSCLVGLVQEPMLGAYDMCILHFASFGVRVRVLCTVGVIFSSSSTLTSTAVATKTTSITTTTNTCSTSTTNSDDEDSHRCRMFNHEP